MGPSTEIIGTETIANNFFRAFTFESAKLKKRARERDTTPKDQFQELNTARQGSGVSRMFNINITFHLLFHNREGKDRGGIEGKGGTGIGEGKGEWEGHGEW